MYLSDALIGASLILVNGIYFKGLWSRQFKTTDTKKAPFFLGEKDAVDVDMMSQTSKFLYGNFPDVGAHAVALPYKVIISKIIFWFSFFMYKADKKIVTMISSPR